MYLISFIWLLGSSGADELFRLDDKWADELVEAAELVDSGMDEFKSSIIILLVVVVSNAAVLAGLLVDVSLFDFGAFVLLLFVDVELF
jgi:hypothetical protein